MKPAETHGTPVNSITLEIPVDKIESLLLSGQLYPCDIRCVDCNAKMVLQKLCLRACTKSVRSI